MLENLEQIIEAILFTAGEPVSIERLQQLTAEQELQGMAEQEEGEPLLENTKIPASDLRLLLQTLGQRYQDRGIELVEVASGYRFQARVEYTSWLQKLHARKSGRYSRAFLETLALIVYRQPLTRGEIEEIRGVAVSTQIIKSLLELEWVRVVGQRDVPGKPALYATTRKFLDDFNLKSLTELPALQEPRDMEQLEQRLAEQLQLEVFIPEAEDAQIQTEEAVPA
jgi:segregation and condensation protein B